MLLLVVLQFYVVVRIMMLHSLLWLLLVVIACRCDAAVAAILMELRNFRLLCLEPFMFLMLISWREIE